MHTSGVDVGAVVADVGSYYSKIGYAGQDLPISYTTTAMGVDNTAAKDKKIGDSKPQNYYFDLINYRENVSVENPIKDGVINNWDLFQKFWENSISSTLKANLKETPVMFAEKPHNTPTSRQKLCQLMFEKYDIPAIFLARDSVLSCYACGKTSGLSVDIGASGTVIAPVVDGWIESKGYAKSFIGGRYIDSQVLHHLAQLGIASKPQFKYTKYYDANEKKVKYASRSVKNCHPTYEAVMNLELGRDIKENCCRVADSALSDYESRFSILPPSQYTLPDGTLIELSIERFQAPEIYFEPTNTNLTQNDMVTLGLAVGTPNSPPVNMDGIHKIIIDSILKCDFEQHSVLVSNIVLSGGGSCMDGLSDRLRLEIEKSVYAAAPTWKPKTVVAGTIERAIGPWLGGSILASIGAFHEMWFSRAEYNEYGASLVDKKCP